jgi:ABC-type antimicrobial peptide transport system permease subunit
VVADAHQYAVKDEAKPEFFAPFDQLRVDAGNRAILARVRGRPAEYLALMHRGIQGLAPTIPFVSVRPFEAVIAPQTRPWRIGGLIFGLFGGAAAVLAMVGVYGLLDQDVMQRRREIGIRVALGAVAPEVALLVFRRTWMVLMMGVALGLIAAWLIAPLAGGILFGVLSRDVPTYAGVAMFLGVATAAASVRPMRFILRIDAAHELRASQ